jgi:hypothetical protein
MGGNGAAGRRRIMLTNQNQTDDDDCPCDDCPPGCPCC